MAKLTQAGYLLDIPLAVKAVVEGSALRVSELLELAGELARANGRRVVRMVNFKGKS
jgi:hypothetical protein